MEFEKAIGIPVFPSIEDLTEEELQKLEEKEEDASDRTTTRDNPENS